MKEALYRIEIFSSVTDFRAEGLRKNLAAAGFNASVTASCDNYLIDAPLSQDEIRRLAEALTSPVTQKYLINSPFIPDEFDYAVQIGYLPGVTDNVAGTVRETAEDMLKRRLDREKSVFSSVTWFFSCRRDTDIMELAAGLYNPLIQRADIMSREEYISMGGMGSVMPLVSISGNAGADTVSLSVSDEELLKIGKSGIADADGTRRGPLALDLPSMKAIAAYFHETEGREPTDIELESIAQTWSEHCKHTIFAASIDDAKDGLYKHYIKGATNRIRSEKGSKDFCLSVFTDNAGGIAFDENWIISDKVETHNSPSALDPFGGAITGIVGVNRDAIGFGMAALPVANRYGFCFADPSDTAKLYRSRSADSALLSPARIMQGVIKGVNAGGNTSGIPTPQGFVYFDKRFKGKPLVFVGTVGLSPRLVNGKPFVEKRAMPGDSIVVVGGRVGRDGIHGATFSSEGLGSGSPATAVQIGDPITQKKLSDAIVKEARDMELYHSITDNGAGGLSCSVAEMAREAGGFEVELNCIPLKYPGLAPWQIWISESQERMTLAVPDEKLNIFLDLMEKRGVEAAVIGKFTSGNRGIVRIGGEKIFDLDMNFLHDGLPEKVLTAKPAPVPALTQDIPEPADLSSAFVKMLSRLNTGSFEFISAQYDHEVQGSSLIKPLQGKGRVNGNASVIKPVFASDRAVVLSQGLYPSYSEYDPFRMAACAIDTAIRNAVAAGGSLDCIALLDNFCWCDSTNPERLFQLKKAAEACYDISVAYGTPFISGKDSMFNDFKGYDEYMNETAVSIPPSLLISSIGVVSDWRFCQSLDFKKAGDIIYIIGETLDETCGSEYASMTGCSGKNVPLVQPEKFIPLYRALEKAMKAGLAASSVSLERGGLAVAAGKSAMAGELGCSLNLDLLPGSAMRSDLKLFSESQGRILVSVAAENCHSFEECFAGLPFASVGVVQGDGKFKVSSCGETVVSVYVDELTSAYKSVFKGF